MFFFFLELYCHLVVIFKLSAASTSSSFSPLPPMVTLHPITIRLPYTCPLFLQDQMLFCDSCDRGFHMECCEPPISTMPKGEVSVARACILNDFIFPPPPPSPGGGISITVPRGPSHAQAVVVHFAGRFIHC